MDYSNSSEIPNILIVDDVTSNLIILTEMIKSVGYIARPVTSARQAMQAIEIKLPDLILLDISMPDMNGYQFCEILKKESITKDIPIIFISAMNAKEDRIRGFRLGAVDFISKPFEIEEVTLRINTHLNLYRMQKELEICNKYLHKMVNEQIVKIVEEEKHFIHSLAKLSELREDPTGSHVRNVAYNCKLLAMSLQLSPKFEKEIGNTFVEAMEIVAPLHDIGKISIHDNILLKPGKLTKEEREVIKTHAQIGADTLMELYNGNEHNEYLKMAIEIAQSHHEHWDGTGYPNGLAKQEIPLAARIMSVIDVYDALMSERCYRKAFTHRESIEIISEESGKSFDPEIIEIFNKIQNKLKGIEEQSIE
ncbi:MAG: response regulator [Acetivibrio sp.]